MDPIVQEFSIGHAGGYAFEGRAGNYFDGIMTLGAVGLEEGFAGLRLRGCGSSEQPGKEDKSGKYSAAFGGEEMAVHTDPVLRKNRAIRFSGA
jgi:hypothetical protein